MSEQLAPEIEKQLRELTAWTGPAPGLWRTALRQAGAAGRRRRRRLPRVPGWAWTGLAAAGVLIAVGLSLDTWPRGRSAAKSADGDSWFRGPATTAVPEARREQARAVGPYAAAARGMMPASERYAGGYAANTGEVAGRPMFGQYAGGTPTAGDPVAGSEITTGPAGERYVVRKATVELGVADVRAVFAKIVHLVSEARGEYVQESSLTGSAEHLEGQLTLRIAVDRLADVLNELRQLGKVRAETAGGEDVTTQVVDIEARLRNERRVEVELLELLEKRQDAPLKEILELRRAIGQVRETIEQLTAQRERLSRLVALATVLVILRPADAPLPAAPGLLGHFAHALREAWLSGARYLADSIALLLSVLVGGLAWWVLLVVAVVVIRAARRRSRRAAARLPAS